MRIILEIKPGLRGLSVAFSRSIAVTTAAVSFANPADDKLTLALQDTPDAVKAIARCGNSHEAFMYWLTNGKPELPCGPEELFYRTKPLHQRPYDWQDDPV